MRLRRPALPWLAACALVATAVPATARSPRFTTVLPEAEPGLWRVKVADPGRRADRLVFAADGQEIAATAAEGGAYRLADVPADTVWLTLSTRGVSKPEAAVRLGPRSEPWSGWSVYHVMVGHFRDGNSGNDGEIDGWKHPAYLGGDLQGVLEEVDYLARLNIDAVWLSPIFPAETSHGYDVRNYFRVGDAVGVPGDPEASLALFRELREALAQRDIGIIVDLPLNHASRAYDNENGVPGGGRPRATGPRQDAEKVWDGWGAGFKYWNFDHQPTRRFLRQAALFWLVEQGAVGLRLDYVRGVPHDFWAELYAAVEVEKPGAWLLGECWIDDAGAEANAREIATFYAPIEGVGPQFHSLLDFPLRITATDVFARHGPAEELERDLQAATVLYGPEALPAYFLDNHDLARFLSWAPDPRRLEVALGFLATLSNPLILFYGTETGLAHGAPKVGFTDQGRLPMPWDGLDEERVARVSELLAARRAHPSWTHGARLPLFADADSLVQAKVVAEEVSLVAVHLGDAPRDLPISLGALEGDYAPLIGATVPEPSEEGGHVWSLAPQSLAVVVMRRSGEVRGSVAADDRAAEGPRGRPEEGP
jgi:cyclomaltodextrinase